ncbi:aquaporin-like protein [Marasmius fiardii PR-910]|nr:aquaporin-like protein [Marasmius fiardii PR-910]
MSHPDVIHLKSVQPPLKIFTVWERNRHRSLHWLVECFAEFLGVFFYVYAGVASQLAFILGKILQQEGLSSILQIGVAYACGIILAITICAGTSGGHINPCVTISFMIFKGFPPLKGLRYIIAQILGAYVACLLIYAQYSHMINLAQEALAAAGQLDAVLFTPNGPAGAFGLYVTPGSKLGQVFLNEFVTDVMLALVIFGCLDPTNTFVSPTSIPVVIALAYGVAVWGFSVPGLAANAARDVGGRLAAITIWGTRANGGSYAAIAALTNIGATLLGFILHELFLTDYARVLPRAQRELMMVHMNHEHSPNRPNAPGHGETLSDSDSHSNKSKGEIREIERLPA